MSTVSLLSVVLYLAVSNYGGESEVPLPPPQSADELISDSESGLSESSLKRKINGTTQSRVLDESETELDIADFNPKEMYERYSGPADSGDMDAKYVQATVLDLCLAPRFEDNVEEWQQLDSPPVELEPGISRSQRCSSLLAEIPDGGQKRDSLYQELHDAGHPLIKVKQRNIPADSKRLMLTLAILADFPEFYMYESVFSEASWFYQQYSEHRNESRQAAWALLSCEASLRCNSRRYREDLRANKYHQHQYDEIVAIEASIRSAIERGDPVALGF